MSNIGAIILAAGMSSRMGKPKLLLPFKGLPLITYPHMLALQNALKPIVCVTGHYDEQMSSVLAPIVPNITLHNNSYYESGMASSLKAGISAVYGKVDAVMIFLGDQPLVPNEVVQTIIAHYLASKEAGIKIVRPLFGHRLGHPILFDSSLFDEFDALQGDEGGKSIIQRHQNAVKLLQFPNSDWGKDIDTEEEYMTLLKGTEGI